MIAINIAKYVFKNKNKNKSAQLSYCCAFTTILLSFSYQMSTKQLTNKKVKTQSRSRSSAKNQEVLFLKMFLVFITYYSFVIHYSVCTLLLFFRILADLWSNSRTKEHIFCSSNKTIGKNTKEWFGKIEQSVAF